MVPHPREGRPTPREEVKRRGLTPTDRLYCADWLAARHRTISCVRCGRFLQFLGQAASTATGKSNIAHGSPRVNHKRTFGWTKRGEGEGG